MNTATVPNRDKEIARQRVNQFVRRFEESYQFLAYHAALPLVLTPELLNYLMPFHFGETITTDLANYNGNYSYGEGHEGEYRQVITPVGSFQVANAFGLFDMHGNVWEWCADHWHDSYEGAPSDGQAWLLDEYKNDNHYRLLRGGSWYFNPVFCRCANRGRGQPDFRYLVSGFRVVCGAAWTPLNP